MRHMDVEIRQAAKARDWRISTFPIEVEVDCTWETDWIDLGGEG